MTDIYRNFSQMSNFEIQGRDFEIEYECRDSPILILAPHGGRIEPFTGPLVKSIADGDFSFYIFKGIKDRANTRLHITSHRFDEPVALGAAAGAETVVALHGASDNGEEFVMVAGLDTRLCLGIEDRLAEAGFAIKLPPRNLAGKHPLNICNRGRSGKGVQLELSRKLRNRLRADHRARDRFVDSVRRELGISI